VEPFPLGFPGRIRFNLELDARLVELGNPEAAPACPSCDLELNLHQPDEKLPGQLLATCESCCQWFSLMEIGDDPTILLMVELPSRSAIEAEMGKVNYSSQR
jgi:hypothetical protein